MYARPNANAASPHICCDSYHVPANAYVYALWNEFAADPATASADASIARYSAVPIVFSVCARVCASASRNSSPFFPCSSSAASSRSAAFRTSTPISSVRPSAARLNASSVNSSARSYVSPSYGNTWSFVSSAAPCFAAPDALTTARASNASHSLAAAS